MLALQVEVDPIAFPDAKRIRKALNKALKIWSAYFRRRVAQYFAEQGPGWAPRKASDDAIAAARETAARNLSEHRLRRKLVREYQRAQKRLNSGRGTMSSVQRRAAVLREFERQVAGGQVGAGVKLKMGSKEQAIAGLSGGIMGGKALQKSLAGLRERKARAEIATAGRVLGRIAQSITTKFGILQVEVASHIPWAGVQNEGGVVGHGAQLPARPFIYVTQDDVNVLVETVNNCLIAEFGEKTNA